MYFIKYAIFIYIFLIMLPTYSYAQSQIGSSGLPLPRFVSIQSDEVNLRTGPGRRYPIEWVYHKEGLPLEITAEFDVWRHVRDFEGSEGWVHKSTLSGKRTFIVTDQNANIYKSPKITSHIIANTDQKVVGKIILCEISWCEIKINDYKGYMQKLSFWGTYSHETFDD